MFFCNKQGEDWSRNNTFGLQTLVSLKIALKRPIIHIFLTFTQKIFTHFQSTWNNAANTIVSAIVLPLKRYITCPDISHRSDFDIYKTVSLLVYIRSCIKVDFLTSYTAQQSFLFQSSQIKCHFDHQDIGKLSG